MFLEMEVSALLYLLDTDSECRVKLEEVCKLDTPGFLIGVASDDMVVLW
jgi:hypothetical protein